MTTKAGLERQVENLMIVNKSLEDKIEELKARVPTSREEVAQMIKEELDQHYDWYHKNVTSCSCCPDLR